MTVEQLCELYIEDTDSVRIYGLEKGEDVFEGTYREAVYSDYADEEVCSFGVEGGIICINID